jgi:hypothetical protein
MEKIFLKGTDVEGIEITCRIDANNRVDRILKVVLYSFGASTQLPDFSDGFLGGMFHYCQVRINQEVKWGELETKFMLRLGEIIIIQSESSYVNALWEFEKKTENCDSMNDLNK